MYGQEEIPLSISDGEEVIHLIEVFIILSHDLLCQRLWQNLMVIFLVYDCFIEQRSA